MVGAEVLIPLVILAITQLIKMAIPQVQSWLTIIVAFLVGVVVALIDQFIGVTDINIATGLVLALAAIGISSAAQKASTAR